MKYSLVDLLIYAILKVITIQCKVYHNFLRFTTELSKFQQNISFLNGQLAKCTKTDIYGLNSKTGVTFEKRIATIASEMQVCKIKCTTCKYNASVFCCFSQKDPQMIAIAFENYVSFNIILLKMKTLYKDKIFKR